MPSSIAAPRTLLLTSLALVAFAGNSILCRLALRNDAIDPWSFMALRLASGALLLAPLLLRRTRQPQPWRPAAGLALLAYALTFSLAYVSLPAGTGALLLFGCVQMTMLGVGFARGERPTPLGAIGIAAAMTGVLILVLPGVLAPDPLGATLMALSGIAWAIYSLLGRSATDPMQATARNFAIAGPLAATALLFATVDATWTTAGVLLAIASGTITSGLGYILWYAALPALTATNAAVVQLAVPAIAAAGGVLALGEALDGRLLLAGALTLGGIAIAVTAKARQNG